MSESTFAAADMIGWFVKLTAISALALHLGFSWWLLVLLVAVIQVEVS